MVEQIPFADLVTPAGIVIAAGLVRQIVEVLKGLGFAAAGWIDAGNERKTAIIVSAVLYAAWAASYAREFPADAWTAFWAFLAVSAGALGVNEAIDAGVSVVRGNVSTVTIDWDGPVSDAEADA